MNYFQKIRTAEFHNPPPYNKEMGGAWRVLGGRGRFKEKQGILYYTHQFWRQEVWHTRQATWEKYQAGQEAEGRSEGKI